MSVEPTTVAPRMRGAIVEPGVPVPGSLYAVPTIADGSVATEAIPFVFVAVMDATSVEATSSRVTTYVDALAPGICRQPVPIALQRSHWKP